MLVIDHIHVHYVFYNSMLLSYIWKVIPRENQKINSTTIEYTVLVYYPIYLNEQINGIPALRE